MKLEMKNISISFPGVLALDNAHFQVEAGRVHALVGANGAGKSTLMKVLTGAHELYTGEIWMGGHRKEIRTPKDAQDNGIQIVHQEVDTALIPYLTVAENIMLIDMIRGMEKKHFVHWKKLRRKAEVVLERLNLVLPVQKLANELTLAEKQMVLIARAISTQCQFLVLDEPTAPLSYTETAELFRVIRELAGQKVGVIFISHRMPEIFEICDEITVMRNGQTVSNDRMSETSQAKIIEQMLGKTLDEQFPARVQNAGSDILQVSELTAPHKLKGINLSVKAGEIVGIAGLVGAGKTELCNALFGSLRLSGGQILFRGKELELTGPHQAVKKGIALVPEERRKEGVFVQENVQTNLTAASLHHFSGPFSFLKRKKERDTAKEMIRLLGIRTSSEEELVQNLSGGNQQKVAIGKWLVADADVYLFDEPTKGVDVGAKKDIYELIAALAERGKSIVYATSELSEIVGITDRVYVLYDGKTVKELKTSDTDEEELLFYSTGGR
ncbi:MAG: sugar ABC transporter ATP-binding protein [Bacillota bacterium]|nr:sugar ABC transporter ATP-binding protein [Bacillota bacterium]